MKMSDGELANRLLLRPTQTSDRINPFSALKSLAYVSLLFLLDGANWIRAGNIKAHDLARYARVVNQTSSNAKLSLKHLMRRLVWSRHSFFPAYHQMFTLNISAARYFFYIAWLEHLVAKFCP